MFLKMARIIDDEASEEYGAFMSEVLNSSGTVQVGDTVSEWGRAGWSLR